MKNFKLNIDNLTATYLFYYEPILITFLIFLATVQYVLILFTRVLE